MKYVMSDIHGMYGKYTAMLKKIKFSKNDILYILGDIVDRGPDSVKMIEYVKNTCENIKMIKGNHEAALAEFIDSMEVYESGNATASDIEYINYLKQCHFMNPTYEKLRVKYSYKQILQIRLWINQLPLVICTEAAGEKYILAHAGAVDPCKEQDEEICLWSREEFYNGPGIRGYITVFGHTPAMAMNHLNKKEKNAKNIFNRAKIWHSDDGNKINIDCGASFREYGGRLACLCLDNKREFYV